MESSVSYHSAQKALQDDGFLMSMFRAEPKTLYACLMRSLHSILHLLLKAVQVSDCMHATDSWMCGAMLHVISHQHRSPAAVPG